MLRSYRSCVLCVNRQVRPHHIYRENELIRLPRPYSHVRRWCLRLIGQAKAFATLLNANAKLSTLGGGYFLTRQVGQAIRLALAQAEVRVRGVLRRSGRPLNLSVFAVDKEPVRILCSTPILQAGFVSLFYLSGGNTDPLGRGSSRLALF